MCFDLQEWELLNEHIILLTKKRGQLKTVVYMCCVTVCMCFGSAKCMAVLYVNYVGDHMKFCDFSVLLNIRMSGHHHTVCIVTLQHVKYAHSGMKPLLLSC